MMEIKGLSASEGYAIGSAYIYRSGAPSICEKILPEGEVDGEIHRFLTARAKAGEGLSKLRDHALQQKETEKADIFAAHLELLTDECMGEAILSAIQADRRYADAAVHAVYTEYERRLAGSANARTRERAADVLDVKNRLLYAISGETPQDLTQLPEKSVLVCRELLSSEIAALSPQSVCAVITETGGETSHTAILARNKGIPAVLSVKDATEIIPQGAQLWVDAVSGTVLIRPTEEEQRHFARLAERWREDRLQAEGYKRAPAQTADGTAIKIELNIGQQIEEELQEADCADGCGLLRTEFLYLKQPALPDEQSQEAMYGRIIRAFGQKPVTLRTLDIGGDKQLAGQAPAQAEANPFLGLRGIRRSMRERDLFDQQLRAAILAGREGNLRIMIPMVTNMEEILQTRTRIEQLRRELNEEGLSVPEKIVFGIMIETPAAALLSDRFAPLVDFACIGTNDLTQYLLAADRGNPQVQAYYQMYHPSVFRLIRFVSECFCKAGKPLCVCGEIAGIPEGAMLLCGLGIRELSMSAARIASVKSMLSHITLQRAQALADSVCSCATEQQVRALLFPADEKQPGK